MIVTAHIVIILGTAVACDYRPHIEDCRVACTAASGCPSGLGCATSEGLCRVTGATRSCAEIFGDAGLDGAVTLPSYTAPVDFATGTNPTTVAIGDLNGDGRPDLAVVNYVSTTVSVFLNTTAAGATLPSFTTRFDFPTGSGPRVCGHR